VAGIALCLLSAGLLAFQIPLAKLAYDHGADPFTFSVARSVMAVVVFLLIARARSIGLGIERARWGGLAAITLSMTAIAFGYLGALERIPAGLTALLFYLFPLIVLAVEAVHARRVPGPGRVLVFVLAFIGLVVAFGPDTAVLDPIGIAMAIVAAVGAATYFWIAPGIAAKVSPILLTGWSNLFVIVLFVPLVVGAGVALPAGALGWAAFLAAALCYAVGLGLTYPALARVGPSKAAVLYNFEPITVVVVSAPLLGEWLTASQYLGAGIVVTALVLASLPKTARSKSTPR
jgi:drug/metabolite transporter (DMT)-like permease